MTKAKTDAPTTVYPVAGTYLAGVAPVPTTAPADLAERLVATGAFGYDAPVDGDPTPDPIPLTDAGLESLSFYAPTAPAPAEE